MYFAFERKKNAYYVLESKHLSTLPHLHEHIEIVLMKSGASIANADIISETVETGDLFIAFPNQVHYYLDQVSLLDAPVLIVSPDMTPEFSRIFKTMVPKSPVLKNAYSNPRVISAVESLVQCSAERGEYSETEVRGCMLILLSELFRNMEMVEKGNYDHDLAKDIISYCYENYNTDISLQSIADVLHISRCYISRIFSKRLHISFNDYINSLRIRKACEMLKAGDVSVTEIAYAVGYNSVRTFDRCFMAVRGMTPKEYRTKALEKKK